MTLSESFALWIWRFTEKSQETYLTTCTAQYSKCRGMNMWGVMAAMQGKRWVIVTLKCEARHHRCCISFIYIQQSIDLPPVLRLQNLIWGQWQPSSQLIHATHTHTSWQSAGSEWPRWDWFSCRTDNCVQFTPASSIQGWLRSHFLFTITLLIQSYNLEHYSHTHPHSYISISLDSWQTVR